MKISDYLKSDFCIMNLTSKTKEDAIREIAVNLTKSSKITDLERFVMDILEREKLGSTGIGYNIAIPHSRTEAVEGFVVGFGKSVDGIDFNSLDGEKVNLIFLMGANPKELSLYLRLLAELSRLLIDNSFRKALMSCTKPEEIIETFKKFENR